MQKNNISIAVCLCVYNNEKGLPMCLENIESIRHIFHRMVINVVYDTSEDKSYQILADFKKRNEDKPMYQRIHMNITINTAKRNLQSKSVNIAACRNMLLDMIRRSYLDYEYFIMMDTNEYSCIGKINVELMHEIIHPEDPKMTNICQNMMQLHLTEKQDIMTGGLYHLTHIFIVFIIL